MDPDALEVEVENEEGQDQEEPSRKKEFEWTKYENMSVEEKRKYYKCGHVEIKDIETWSEFYQSNGYLFSKIQKRTKVEKPVYSFDANINDKISLWEGDITQLEIDAIVNEANRSLLGGGGVDGCIHRAAGETLVEECRLLNGCDTGDAKITSGHKLPAKYVIHTVGPIGKDEKALKNCYQNCLKLALENQVRTLAFCCVSTGIYGYPNRDAAEVALKTTRKWLEDESNAKAVERIIFCLFLPKDIDIYQTLMLKYFPPVELQKPTKKSEDKAAKTSAKSEEDEAKRKKEREEKDTRTKHKDDTKKSDNKNIKLGKNLDTKKERAEMKTEMKKEKDEGKVTGALEAKEDGSLLKEGGNEKPDEDEKMKEVEGMQKGRSMDDSTEKRGKVTGALEAKEDESLLKERSNEKPDDDEEMKKVEEMQKGRKDIVEAKEDENSSKAGERIKETEEPQMGRKMKDNESAKSEIPIPKKQKQGNIDDSTEERGLQDVEMIEEEQPQAQQEKKTEGQDERMDMGDLAQQEREKNEEMEAENTTVTSQQDVIKESPESPPKIVV